MSLINTSEYMTLSLIGKGIHPVLKVQSIETQKEFALKKITRENVQHHASDLQEIMLLSSINHPNIIKILGFETKQLLHQKNPSYILYILMDLMKKNLGEEIVERRDKFQYFSTEELLKLIRDLLEALNYLHDKGIAHRDLKPENILLSGENRLILTDFNDSFKRNEIKPTPRTIVGSPYYMSPEIRKAYVENEELNEKNYDAFKSDVYSLGMTIVDLSSISVGEKRSIKEKLDGMKKRYGVQLVEFVKKMLEFDFRNRKGVKELKILLEDLVKNQEPQITSPLLPFHEIDHLKECELSLEVFEFFNNQPFTRQTKQKFLLNLERLCSLEEENRNLHRLMQESKEEQLRNHLEIVVKPLKMTNHTRIIQKKMSILRKITSIFFCSP